MEAKSKSKLRGGSGYERLEVYQRAMTLVPQVHDFVTTLPNSERFELVSQLRRASKSIPANIAEGYAKRKSAKDFRHFLTMAMASANEVEVHLKIARNLGYLTEQRHQQLASEFSILGKQLNRLVASWQHGVPATSN